MFVYKEYLFNKNKLDYVKGEKPEVKCILCAIKDNHPDIINLEVFRSKNFLISVNLYPYNPGHLLIFPIRHIEDISQLINAEIIEMHNLIIKSQSILREEFNPSGFNVGFNLGHFSGASIEHIHQHIVPRYANEAGFMDIIAGTRLIVHDPNEMMGKLRKKFKELK